MIPEELGSHCPKFEWIRRLRAPFSSSNPYPRNALLITNTSSFKHRPWVELLHSCGEVLRVLQHIAALTFGSGFFRFWEPRLHGRYSSLILIPALAGESTPEDIHTAG